MKECIPMSVPKRKKNLYITQKVKSLKNKRNCLWRRYAISKSHSDYLAYTKTHNALRALKHNLRKQFERQIADNVKENPKKFWNYARAKMKTCPVIGNIEDVDGNLHTLDEDLSSSFKYFSSVFTQEDLNTVPTFHVDKCDQISLSTITINPSLVFEKLISLKTGKSSGPDGWPVEVFKQYADQLCVPLSILLTKSLESCSLPEDWKSGHITPIYKMGNKTKVNNYRPVCLTSIVIKILVSIIRDSLSTYLSDNNLVSSNQHGFILKRSCCTQLLYTLNDWTLSLDEHFSTGIRGGSRIHKRGGAQMQYSEHDNCV